MKWGRRGGGDGQKGGRATNKNGITQSSGRCTAEGRDKAGMGEEIKGGGIFPTMAHTR